LYIGSLPTVWSSNV